MVCIQRYIAVDKEEITPRQQASVSLARFFEPLVFRTLTKLALFYFPLVLNTAKRITLYLDIKALFVTGSG